MSLIPYGDSSSEDEISPQTTGPLIGYKRKGSQSPPLRKMPPPLPSSLNNLYSSKSRSSTTDDPALHDGRVRQIPHIAGNWSAHLYLEWIPEETAAVSFETVIEEARKSLATSLPDQKRPLLHSFLLSDLKARLPLHISLSAPLVLSTTNKDLFQADLRSALTEASLQPFTVHPVALNWVNNVDNTRSFLVIGLSRPKEDTLNRLLDVCNKICVKYGQPPLYENRVKDETNVAGDSQSSFENVQLPDRSSKFHISIAWTLASNEDLSGINFDLEVGQLSSILIPFDTVLVRIGNMVEAVSLEDGEVVL